MCDFNPHHSHILYEYYNLQAKIKRIAYLLQLVRSSVDCHPHWSVISLHYVLLFSTVRLLFYYFYGKNRRYTALKRVRLEIFYVLTDHLIIINIDRVEYIFFSFLRRLNAFLYFFFLLFFCHFVLKKRPVETYFTLQSNAWIIKIYFS